jgi:hypothetical protein
MKKIFLILFCIFLFSCNNKTEEDLNNDISLLRAEKQELDRQIYQLERILVNLYNEWNNAGVLSGDIGVFVLEIKQSTFTLDIAEHLKNNMNSIKIAIPVDPDFYVQYEEGDIITSQGKLGSFLIDEDFSQLKIRVVGKYSIIRGISFDEKF